MIRAISVSPLQGEPVGIVSLTYDDRYRRRLALQCQNGFAFLLDLPKVIELRDGDDLVLEDGRHIRVKAAAEPLMRASCTDHHHLLRLIWHVGNRHVPCEIHPDHLILRSDHVIADMLRHLGADVVLFEGAFNPEGGAYGQGRTHGHAH
ncbi:MAG: urease accessory protein UreE [Cohaesibacter sp.]|nr:urease accessory protein UreE [Cohaesibacter sp.]MCV6603191.1 urease accessory protein UreE [Cohaesibacter sp.]